MRKAKVSGFSLVEVIISVFLLSLLTLFIIQAILTSHRIARINKERMVLLNEAYNVIESELAGKSYQTTGIDLEIDKEFLNDYVIIRVRAKSEKLDQEVELQRYVKSQS